MLSNRAHQRFLGLNEKIKKQSYSLKVPKKINASTSSMEFAKLLFNKANLVVTPGVGFGKYGEGYVRFALTVDKNRVNQAIERLRKIF